MPRALFPVPVLEHLTLTSLLDLKVPQRPIRKHSRTPIPGMADSTVPTEIEVTTSSSSPITSDNVK